MDGVSGVCDGAEEIGTVERECRIGGDLVGREDAVLSALCADARRRPTRAVVGIGAIWSGCDARQSKKMEIVVYEKAKEKNKIKRKEMQKEKAS